MLFFVWVILTAFTSIYSVIHDIDTISRLYLVNFLMAKMLYKANAAQNHPELWYLVEDVNFLFLISLFCSNGPKFKCKFGTFICNWNLSIFMYKGCQRRHVFTGSITNSADFPRSIFRLVFIPLSSGSEYLDNSDVATTDLFDNCFRSPSDASRQMCKSVGITAPPTYSAFAKEG